MPFVCVYVFKQKLRKNDLKRIKDEIPEVFVQLAQSKGQRYTSTNVGVTILDGVSRNVFSPESHAKGFQGLDVLLLIYGVMPNNYDQQELRERLESKFRDKWVVRARIFDVKEDHWKVPVWPEGYTPLWKLS